MTPQKDKLIGLILPLVGERVTAEQFEAVVDKIIEERTKCNKVYVVETSAGQYDDYTFWIEGIYTDPIEAEKLRDAKEKEYREISTKESITYNESIAMSDAEFETYMEKDSLQRILKEGFTVTVTERELNKRYT